MRKWTLWDLVALVAFAAVVGFVIWWQTVYQRSLKVDCRSLGGEVVEVQNSRGSWFCHGAEL